jgi:hypothetical protein
VTDKQTEKDGHLHNWRGARRQSLREQIKATDLLTDMELIRKQCMENAPTMSANHVGALKLAADIAAKQLAKVLPDVKAVEHDPGEHTERLQRDTLNVRIAELYAAANRRLDGRGSSGTVSGDIGAESTH